jgi:transcriptional regulator with XRE-family HTH domain
MIGKNIKEFRKKTGITQTQLADKANVEQTLISRYENGVIDPPISRLIAIANALKIEVAELLK